MENLEKLLKKLGVPAAEIAKAKEDGADIDTIADAVKADQLEIVTSQLKPALTEELKADINKQALLAIHGSLKTKLKRDLNLQIPDARTMEFDDFLTAAVKEVETRSSQQTSDQIESVRTRLTEALEKVEDLSGKLTAKEQEVVDRIAAAHNELHAESNISKAFRGIKWGGKPETIEFVQDSLEKDIKSNFIVDKDGGIKNKDGTPVVKDGNVIVKTLVDYVSATPVVQSLIKQNDARGDETPGGYAQSATTTQPANAQAAKAKELADKYIAEMG